MIDFHAHILPGIDDGAKDLSESYQLLVSQKSQGIDTVVATPHYLGRKTVSEFIEKRNAAYEAVMQEGYQDIPEIILGAEVALYYGLSEREDLALTCVQGTNYILLELPMEYWNDWVFDEIYKVSVKHHVKPIIAHLDRYMDENKRQIDRLLALDVVIQINAEALFRMASRRFVKKVWKQKEMLLLGSDCHNLTNRKCELAKADAIIKRILGKEASQIITDAGERILKNN